MSPHSDYELLGARGLRVELGGRRILDDVSLRIGAGERVAIVGPNGAGKTTLLRALSGAVPITAGDAILCTEPLRGLPRATIAKSIAVVGADLSLPFATRADELVALGRLPYGSGRVGPTDDDRARADAALNRVNASHLAARDVRTLSAGERQLVLIALGLAQETPILALDEPTVHLDLRHRIAIVDLLVDLSAHDERTIVAIFHELDLVRDAFPRAILVAEGRIVADGAPSEVLNAERVAAAWGIDVARARRLGAA